MSKSDRYFTAPLSILRRGKNPLEALLIALHCGIVNAGIGYQKAHGEDDFKTLLNDANEDAEKRRIPTRPPPNFRLKTPEGREMTKWESENVWLCAHAGAKLCGVTGGNRADDAQVWATNRYEGEVFFRITSEWLWGAIDTQRRDAGVDVTSDFKPLSWREFRILAAVLSAPVNRQGFVFLGWESIQARSCGFHNKALFAAGHESLPPHCQPLTRSQIDLTTSRLEVNRFYIRFRYSKGDRGGKTAYSFRHDSREKIAAAVGEHQSHCCIKQAVQANRTRDRELSVLMQASSKDAFN
jgi:hypothetical protein